VSGHPVRHDAEVASFATGLRALFARYWLSGFLAHFGGGAPALAGAVAMLACRHRRVTT
jgi:hypothetical protein